MLRFYEAWTSFSLFCYNFTKVLQRFCFSEAETHFITKVALLRSLRLFTSFLILQRFSRDSLHYKCCASPKPAFVYLIFNSTKVLFLRNLHCFGEAKPLYLHVLSQHFQRRTRQNAPAVGKANKNCQ